MEKSQANDEIKAASTSSNEDHTGYDDVANPISDTHKLHGHHDSSEYYRDPSLWYNKKLFGFLPPYSAAMFQIVMLSFVIFMTPGMFNALSGLGGAGISDIKTADNANVALYSTFATIGFFGGTIVNYIGIKAALCFGGTGYACYAASLLCYYHTQNSGFVIFAGAYLGVCAGCLWAAQGSIILSYPTEDRKGTAIMVFWIIFNLGAVIGAIIPLANNLENKGSAVNDGTYTAFLVLMCCGSIIAAFMLPMDKVWRSDGTKILFQRYPNWKEELMNLFKLAIAKPEIFSLFPMFFSSNWFYTYQFNEFNAARFNIRTRSLNSLLYWLAQMIGSLFIGTILDLKFFRRSTRARIGWVIAFVTGMAIWGGGLKFQQEYTRELAKTMTPIDFKDGSYIGPMFLYIFYGIYDALYQSYILWTLGALSNNPQTVSLYAGFYKGIQSAAAAIAWRIDAMEVSYMRFFISSWALPVGSLLVALPMIFFRITDHTDSEEDGTESVMDLKSIRSGVENPALVV